LRVHHGAVDHSTITTKPPPEVMKHVREVLEGMGMDIRLENEFKYRCIRLKRKKTGTNDDSSPLGSPVVVEPSPPSSPEPLYGDTAQDAGDEVRFSVELTRLDRLNDTFSLDIRRLKGNLRSYKFLYDTLRECVAFS
ncbi:hypothetical protein PILCRDRAFT_56007, partial [Piloderma croceum F 1598]